MPLQQRSMDKCCMIHHVGIGYKEDNYMYTYMHVIQFDATKVQDLCEV